jgi:hypothetical protein
VESGFPSESATTQKFWNSVARRRQLTLWVCVRITAREGLVIFWQLPRPEIAKPRLVTSSVIWLQCSKNSVSRGRLGGLGNESLGNERLGQSDLFSLTGETYSGSKQRQNNSKTA